MIVSMVNLMSLLELKLIISEFISNKITNRKLYGELFTMEKKC